MTVLKMSDLDLQGKRVLIREDLNVPVKDGVVTSDARILASLPTIKLALEKGAAVMVCSHLGRPTEGEFSAENSLKPVADYLSKALGRDVPLVADYLGGVDVKAGDVVLFENVRFNKGEKKNADELAQQYAALCDVFVMDAFGTAHRAEGSTHGVAKFAKVAAAGPLLAAELDALGKALGAPAQPMAAIVAGSKVSTKLDVLNSLSQICNQLIVGGDGASGVQQVRLVQGFADRVTGSGQEGVGNAAADDQLVADLAQAVQHVEFGRDLGAGNNRRHWLGRSAEGFAQCVQFGSQQWASSGDFGELGHAMGRTLGAVSGAEGIHHELSLIHISEPTRPY